MSTRLNDARCSVRAGGSEADRRARPARRASCKPRQQSCRATSRSSSAKSLINSRRARQPARESCDQTSTAVVGNLADAVEHAEGRRNRCADRRRRRRRSAVRQRKQRHDSTAGRQTVSGKQRPNVASGIATGSAEQIIDRSQARCRCRGPSRCTWTGAGLRSEHAAAGSRPV